MSLPAGRPTMFPGTDGTPPRTATRYWNPVPSAPSRREDRTVPSTQRTDKTTEAPG